MSSADNFHFLMFDMHRPIFVLSLLRHFNLHLCTNEPTANDFELVVCLEQASCTLPRSTLLFVCCGSTKRMKLFPDMNFFPGGIWQCSGGLSFVSCLHRTYFAMVQLLNAGGAIPTSVHIVDIDSLQETGDGSACIVELSNKRMLISNDRMRLVNLAYWLQTTQHTNVGAVTPD